MRPYISKDQCRCCKECVTICPYDVFSEEDGEVKATNPEDCVECLSCVETCPAKAIFMDD